MGILAPRRLWVAVGLVVAVSFAACTGDGGSEPTPNVSVAPDAVMTEVPDPEPATSGDPVVIAEGGGTAEFAGVSIHLPDGAVPDGSQVTAAAGVPPGRYAGEVWGTPLSVEHPDPLEGAATVTWDISGLGSDQRDSLLLVRWDPGIAAWVPQDVPQRIEGDALLAEIDEFSFWDWVADFGQEYGELVGTRIDAPSCSGNPHAWVRQLVSPSEDMEAAGVGVCFEPDREEIMTVRVGNNRTFTQQMEMIRGGQTWAWAWAGENTVGIEQAAYDAARLVFDTDTRFLMPPLREVAVGVDRPDGAASYVEAQVDVSGYTVATDAMVYALNQLPIGGISNPTLNAAIQAIYSCFGKQFLGGGYRDSKGMVRDVLDTLAGCADQAFTTSGSDFSDVVVDTMDNAKYVRTTQYLRSALRTLKYGELAFYASDQLADAAVDPLTWGIRGNPRTGPLGQWLPTCTDLDQDSNVLYRNLALQDQFADTSVEYHDFPGWAAAAEQAVAPLQDRCSDQHNQKLAVLIADGWSDTEAAQTVADILSPGWRDPKAQPPVPSLAEPYQFFHREWALEEYDQVSQHGLVASQDGRKLYLTWLSRFHRPCFEGTWDGEAYRGTFADLEEYPASALPYIEEDGQMHLRVWAERTLFEDTTNDQDWTASTLDYLRSVGAEMPADPIESVHCGNGPD